MRMISLLKGSFAGNSPRFGFLLFLFMVIERKMQLSGVSQGQGAIILQFLFTIENKQQNKRLRLKRSIR